jgi:hypothetical protein
MTKINLEYFGMPGSGATVKARRRSRNSALPRASGCGERPK